MQHRVKCSVIMSRLLSVLNAHILHGVHFVLSTGFMISTSLPRCLLILIHGLTGRDAVQGSLPKKQVRNQNVLFDFIYYVIEYQIVIRNSLLLCHWQGLKIHKDKFVLYVYLQAFATCVFFWKQHQDNSRLFTYLELDWF